MKFSQILENILRNLEEQLPDNVTKFLQIQLNYLKINPTIKPKSVMLSLPDDQCWAISIIKNNLGPLDQKNKYPFFFITGSAGTGESYMTKTYCWWINKKGEKNIANCPNSNSCFKY